MVMMSIIPPPSATESFLEKFGLRNSNSAHKIVGKNNEIKSDCVAKLTHLFMNGKHIASIVSKNGVHDYMKVIKYFFLPLHRVIYHHVKI